MPRESKFANKHTRRGNGAGCGPGWGGEAKGAAVDRKPKAEITTENASSIRAMPANARAEARRQRAAEMEDVIYHLATNAEREETKLTAATKLHAIYEGAPVARTVTYNANELAELDDGALESRRAELEAKLRGRVAGNAAEAVGKPH